MHSHKYQSDGKALAIWSGCCGLGSVILSVVVIGVLLSIPAIVLGHVALTRQVELRPLAIAGIISGYISLVGVMSVGVIGAILL